MLCAVNSQVVKGKERSKKKKSANQRKSREEGKTKGEISGQIDQSAIPNTTKRGDEFTWVSKRLFCPPSNLFQQNTPIIVTGVPLINFIAKKQRSSLPSMSLM